MRVVLADDHQLVRAGLRALLQSFADVQVLAECGDGHEALALVDRLQPDVLLLDITLPGLNGLDVAQRVPKLSPHTRVLILSMHTGAEYVGQALRAGVAGYLVKDSAVDELRVALDSIRAGLWLFPARVVDDIHQHVKVDRLLNPEFDPVLYRALPRIRHAGHQDDRRTLGSSFR